MNLDQGGWQSEYSLLQIFTNQYVTFIPRRDFHSHQHPHLPSCILVLLPLLAQRILEMSERRNCHLLRMAAAQNVFRAIPSGGSVYPALQFSQVRPGASAAVMERFWGKIASFSTRYHDGDYTWTGCEEVRAWNEVNRDVKKKNPSSDRIAPLTALKQACEKCANSKTKRRCIIDENHTTCRPCRTLKIACDRKTKYLFDMTKDEFFPDYEQFIHAYQSRDDTRKRGIQKARSTKTRVRRHKRTASEFGDYRSDEDTNPLVQDAFRNTSSSTDEDLPSVHMSVMPNGDLSVGLPGQGYGEPSVHGDDDAYVVNMLISIVVSKLQPLMVGLRPLDEDNELGVDAAQSVPMRLADSLHRSRGEIRRILHAEIE
ncbi:hypothetical protein C8R46DRAFT_1038269 [Mycena filopes]|nr:hypothetical protein C8R46DRAFT_1038269 [Mycena filopes]